MERPEIGYQIVGEFDKVVCGSCGHAVPEGDEVVVLGLDADVRMYCENCTEDTTPAVFSLDIHDMEDCRGCGRLLEDGMPVLVCNVTNRAYCNARCYESAQESAYIRRCESNVANG